MIYKIALILSLITSALLGQDIINSIVVGGVTSVSARFWVKVSADASINIELSEFEEFDNSIFGTSIEVDSVTNYSSILDVIGLLPNTKYYYRGIVNGVPENYKGRYFTTFPLPGTVNEFSFAFGSCQQSGTFLPSNTESGNVFREIVKHDLQFFLQLGDWTYPDSLDNLPFDSTFFPVDYKNVQESYSHKFNKLFPMDSLLKTMPVDYIYDDHDYMTNNSSAFTSSYYIPIKPNFLSDDFVAIEFGNPLQARENSIKGYRQNMPTYSLQNETRGIYHKFTFGDAEFFMLDLRSQRSGDLTAFSKDVSNDEWVFSPDQNHSILGREDASGQGETQLTWFLNSLLSSTATWKFIISSVPFNKGQSQIISKGIEIQDSVLNIPELPAGIMGIFAAFEISDSWAGFPSDIDTILSFIENNNIKNVIVLSGDSHNAAMDDGFNAGLPEIMAGGLDITNSKTVALMQSFGINIWNKGGQGISTDEFNNAFGKVTVFGSDSVKLELIDEFGTKFADNTILNKNATSVPNDEILATNFRLEQNYPNPFNPSTTIRYQIPTESHVTLRVYDFLGREVATLLNAKQTAGRYSVRFNADNLSSGLYLYRIKINGFSQSKKMMLLR